MQELVELYFDGVDEKKEYEKNVLSVIQECFKEEKLEKLNLSISITLTTTKKKPKPTKTMP